MIERDTRHWHNDPTLKQTTMPTLTGHDPEEKRQEILRYFRQTYAIDTALYETLRFEESFYLRADPLRHPLIFYYGHTAAFYVNKLTVARLIDQRITPHFESMFAIGVDEMSWDDLNEAHYDWPTVPEVDHYRQQVKTRVETLIETLPLELPISWGSPWWAVMMAIEHQRIHLETSSVLIRQLPLAHLCCHPLWTAEQQCGQAPDNTLLDVTGGSVTVGRPLEHPYYGWDCEYGQQQHRISPFKMSRYLVSNEEFRPFVEQGGYKEQQWWTDEGWRWCQYEQAMMPRFWRKKDHGYQLRTMLAEQPMPWNWPVEVNYLEAKAFCNWKAAQSAQPVRLPSEAEWLHWHDLVNPGYSRAGDTPGNINLAQAASSCPVDRFTCNGFGDVIGNVWQWTETAVDSLPGFRIHPYYDDFSTPTFDGQHNIIKGGSWISTGNEATREARYAFRRHFYQHAGFRYMTSDQPMTELPPSKETDPTIARLCHDHYGSSHHDNFMQQLVELAIRHLGPTLRQRALQVGCEAGRGSFELARYFDQVIGIDLSANIIRRAVEMAEQGHISYQLVEEGELISQHQATLAQFNLTGIAEKVSFLQADPCNLKPLYHGYDLIIVSQILERLYDPGKFLRTLSQRLNPQGLLVIATSYDWNDAITSPQQRIGGQRIDGEPVCGAKALKDALQATMVQHPHHYSLERKLHRHRYSALWQQSDITLWGHREDSV